MTDKWLRISGYFFSYIMEKSSRLLLPALGALIAIWPIVTQPATFSDYTGPE